MHEIQVIVGTHGSVGDLLPLLGAPEVQQLANGLQLIPVSEIAVASALGLRAFRWPDLEDMEDITEIAQCLDPFVRFVGQARPNGDAALVLTQYWGGKGNQAAVCFRDGAVALGPVVGPGAVNKALCSIGVITQPGRDEWDTIELTRWRSMADLGSQGTS